MRKPACCSAAGGSWVGCAGNFGYSRARPAEYTLVQSTRLTAHETIMKLADEFRQNADEWRQIEKIAATDDHRRRIAEIADTWLAWAEQRE